MRKRACILLAGAILCLACSLAPVDDLQTLELAKVLEENCASQPFATMRLYGKTLLNRAGKREFGDTLSQVLRKEKAGLRIGEESLLCARELLQGDYGFDTAPDEVVHAVHRDADQTPYRDLDFWRMSGDYVFYYRT